MLHFPVRSFDQFRHKFLTHYEASGTRLRGEHVRAHAAALQGRLEDVYDELCVDGARLRRGLDDGSLIVDTRIRDAARALTVDPSSLRFPGRTPPDEVGYAIDGAVLDAGELVRLQRRVDVLRSRVSGRDRRGGRRLTFNPSR